MGPKQRRYACSSLQAAVGPPPSRLGLSDYSGREHGAHDFALYVAFVKLAAEGSVEMIAMQMPHWCQKHEPKFNQRCD